MRNILIIFISLLFFSCDDNIPTNKPRFDVVRILTTDREAEKTEFYSIDTIIYVQSNVLYDNDTINLIFSCSTLNSKIVNFTCENKFNDYDTIFVTCPTSAKISKDGNIKGGSMTNVIEHKFKLPAIAEDEPSPQVIELNYKCIDENGESYSKKMAIEYYVSNKFKTIEYFGMYFSRKDVLNLNTGEVCRVKDMIGKEEDIYLVRGEGNTLYSPDDPALINSDFYPENFDKSKLRTTKFRWNYDLWFDEVMDSDIKSIAIEKSEVIEDYYEDDLIEFQTSDGKKGCIYIYRENTFNIKYLD